MCVFGVGVASTMPPRRNKPNRDKTDGLAGWLAGQAHLPGPSCPRSQIGAWMQVPSKIR